MTTQIVVIIPTYGRSALLERTLLSLSECELPKEYCKTVVVENGTKGQAEEVCLKFSSIKCEYLYSEIANKSTALNKALSNLEEDVFIIFFDDDIRIGKKTLVAYSDALKQNGINYFFGGPFGVDYESKPSSLYNEFLPRSARGWEYDTKKDLIPFDFIGFNWAVHRKHLMVLNGFNPKFGPNSTTGATGQEHDMMSRLSNIGLLPFYVKKARVWHYVPKDRSSFFWLLRRIFKDGISEGIRNSKWTDNQVYQERKRNYKLLARHLIFLNHKEAISCIMRLQRLKGLSNGIKKRN